MRDKDGGGVIHVNIDNMCEIIFEWPYCINLLSILNKLFKQKMHLCSMYESLLQIDLIRINTDAYHLASFCGNFA